jgi:hypothetical protein
LRYLTKNTQNCAGAPTFGRMADVRTVVSQFRLSNLKFTTKRAEVLEVVLEMIQTCAVCVVGLMDATWKLISIESQSLSHNDTRNSSGEGY